jgi:hypothetical protein
MQSITFPRAGISGSYLIATIKMTTNSNIIQWDYTAFGGANIGDQITALVQFINRSSGTFALLAPVVPITALNVTAKDYILASGAYSTVTGTLPAAVAVGDVLIGLFSGHTFGGSYSMGTITDNLGNTWNSAIFHPQSGGQGIGCAWTIATFSGTCTISAPAPGLTSVTFIVTNFGAGVTAVDTTGASDGSTQPTPPAITTTANHDLIVTGQMGGVGPGYGTGGTLPTVTSPEAIVTSTPDTPGWQGLAMAFELQTAAGAFATSISGNAQPVNTVQSVVCVAFKVTAPAPPAQTTNVQVNPTGTVTHISGPLTLSKIIVGGGGNDIESSAEMVALGDMIYGGVGGTVQGLSGNTTTTPKYLSQTGTGSASAAPTWQPAPAGSVTTKGDLQGYDTAPDRIPVGSNGQVLTADSTQALGLKWATGGGGSSPLTTKGDVYGFDTADARIPVGSDGQVLTADSTQALGVKWAAGGGGGDSTLLQDVDFSAASGSLALDSAGQNHIWLSTSGCSIVSGGVSTDGSTGYFDSGPIMIQRYTWSVAVKLKTTSNSSGTYYLEPCIFGLALNGNGNDFGLTVHNGKAATWNGMYSGSDFQAVSSVAINDGVYHTVVATCNGSVIKVYVDGIDASIDSSTPINTCFGNHRGSNVGLTPYMGQVNALDVTGGNQGLLAATFARMQVYGVALTATQVAALVL